jgi:hypothetical protein
MRQFRVLPAHSGWLFLVALAACPAAKETEPDAGGIRDAGVEAPGAGGTTNSGGMGGGGMGGGGGIRAATSWHTCRQDPLGNAGASGCSPPVIDVEFTSEVVEPGRYEATIRFPDQTISCTGLIEQRCAGWSTTSCTSSTPDAMTDAPPLYPVAEWIPGTAGVCREGGAATGIRVLEGALRARQTETLPDQAEVILTKGGRVIAQASYPLSYLCTDGRCPLPHAGPFRLAVPAAETATGGPGGAGIQAAALACGRSRKSTSVREVIKAGQFRSVVTGTWVLCSEVGLTGHPQAAMEVKADGTFTLLGWNAEGTSWQRLAGAENQGRFVGMDANGPITIESGGASAQIVAEWWQGPRSIRLRRLDSGIDHDYVAADDLAPMPAILP